MNKQRRQRLNNLYNEMEMISSTLEDEDFVEKDHIDDVLSELQTVKDKLEEVLSEEEWAFDSRSEGSQASWSGQISEEAIDAMYDTQDHLDEVEESLIKLKTLKETEEKAEEIQNAVNAMEEACDSLSEIDFY